MKLPQPLEAVVEALQKLPGVGAKSAQRMALHLLKEGPQSMEHLVGERTKCGPIQLFGRVAQALQP